MLRHAAHRLASRAAAAGSGSISRRALATAQAPAEAGEDPAFLEAWKKVTTIIEPPQTPMSAMKPRPPTPASIPSKLTVNFVLPYKSEITNKEVYRRNLPRRPTSRSQIRACVSRVSDRWRDLAVGFFGRRLGVWERGLCDLVHPAGWVES
jgi:hypothetical protein